MSSLNTTDVHGRAAAFYEALSDAQSPARRVGWESDAAHLLRLRALSDALGPLEMLSEVRDVGCGEGRLLEVLNARGYQGRYVGEDVLPSMLVRARKAHPLATFKAHNAFEPGERASAIVSSGMLNTPLGKDHQAAAHTLLRTLWERSEQTLVIDFAVADATTPSRAARQVNLMQMWSLARELTPLVSVREDIVHGEALMVMRRSRRPVLETLLPGERWASSRARILLASREPEAVRHTLSSTQSEEALLWQALADLFVGRALDAERSLRARITHPTLGSRALLHLGVVLLGTRREAEALEVLRSAAKHDTEAADEACVMLAEHAQRVGNQEQAQHWIRQVRDPWIRRELSED